MKILFCSHTALTKELGAPKVLMELAEALREISCDCTLLGPAELKSDTYVDRAYKGESYNQALRDYLREHADRYDVVDYGHEYLPYPRSEFPRRPLFVARSVLLVHHLQTIRIPVTPTLRSALGRLIYGKARMTERDGRVERATKTVQAADLVNVSNHDDQAELLRRGIPAGKIAVIPFGLTRERRLLFEATQNASPASKNPNLIIAFVGTFDPRKGAVEFPNIVRNVVERVPSARFRLFGTNGHFPTKDSVVNYFPRGIRQFIEVIPRFRHEELPELLASCSMGIFPSYIEGFPFGVLEMLAASLPVVSYNAPGQTMMLPREYLVKRGDVVALCSKLIELLSDQEKLAQARLRAKEIANQFGWEKAAEATVNIYKQCLEHRTIALSASK